MARPACVAALLVVAVAAPPRAAGRCAAGGCAPSPVSNRGGVDLASTYGSGSFGRWQVDGFGLPDYAYTADEGRDPNARQPELGGSTAAQHQLGNDNIKGAAFNDGYTQLWSQDRLMQWANVFQPAPRHYAGGFGWLQAGGRVLSTLYLDRAPGAVFQRHFGVGYYLKRMRTDRVQVAQVTYAPFGNDPVLLDDVTIRNASRVTRRVAWFEYWDVNPDDQTVGEGGTRGLARPYWNARRRTLSVAQYGNNPGDTAPLSIFAAALRGPLQGHETSLATFFGRGDRRAPAEVSADRLSGRLAGASAPGSRSHALFVFRAPVRLRPGQSVTLRYVYGMAHPREIAALVTKYRTARAPLRASARAWAAWLPRADFGASRRSVARELAWDAYLQRSATVYEEDCHSHTITQGGYYQYGLGLNLGFRSWLHYLLPISYTDPGLAREILRYSVSLQPRDTLQFPYGTAPLCAAYNLGTSDDADFWLVLGAAQYGLATRDTAFFNQQVGFYRSAQRASLWEHIKLAYRHQESLLGPHGGYLAGSTGDWSDLTPTYLGMTESMLVPAQTAYAYPRLALLADLRGDRRFAAQLRASAARDLATLRREWTGGGWYARGYAGNRRLGRGAIFEEPQPWAILAGAPSARQAITLVHNIRRYLDGVGAPAALNGPTRIGTALSPAASDPGVTERSQPPGAGVPDGHADYVGGVWYDVNGWLAWSLAALDGVLPEARQLAWSEYTRNTLAAHANAFPAHWAGTISVDDACYSYYAQHPDYCGAIRSPYDGQITEQPTWMVMDAVNLAGITPTAAGYAIAPHLPFSRFSLRLPEVGLAAQPGLLRGYLVTQRTSTLELEVRTPADARTRTVVSWAGGRRVRHRVAHGSVSFTLPAVAGRPANWALSWR
ncbi:MAG: GH36-type glycosyl hydrolase domain-containing protein [Solirubrobacteraceae bacterium]